MTAVDFKSAGIGGIADVSGGEGVISTAGVAKGVAKTVEAINCR
jgi:hypothetical protein